jgi:hypothetical protein
MKRIERFEDLVAWQKARNLAKAIYQVTRLNADSTYGCLDHV